MQRRKFLALAGGGIILAAGGGALGYKITRTPVAAGEPWRLAGSAYSEPRKKALSYAILAPNPHNQQPWIADLSEDETVVIRPNLEKMLPHTDPFNRQITIGFGCFLELLTMAAAADGYRLDTELFPDGQNENALDDRPILRAKFIEDSSLRPDPLFAQVLNRRSYKDPFDLEKMVSDETLAKISSATNEPTSVGFTNEPARVAELRQLAEEGSRIEMYTPRTHKESIDVLRIGAVEVNANPDGIDLTGPLFEALKMFGQISREELEKIGSAQFEQGKDGVLEPPRSAQAFMWLTTAGNDRQKQIAAGRDWIRLNMAATAEGVAFHPLSQTLQEYPEMRELYTTVHDKLAAEGHTVQMLVRLGYAPTTIPPSPRWPIDAKIA